MKPLPSGSFKILPQKVVEVQHVSLLAELDVIGDVLQYLGHEHQTSFDVRRRLPVQNLVLKGGHYRRVDKPEINKKSSTLTTVSSLC